MMKLLIANFARLRMNAVFRLGIVVSLVLGAALPTIGNWINTTLSEITNGSMGHVLGGSSLDFYCFSWVLLIVFFFALFSGIFVGADYSNGTFRNKIAAGCSRTEIYFANLITITVAGWILYTLYMVINLCVGISCTGGFRIFEPGTVALYIVYIYLILVSFSAIFTLISMLIPNQAAAVVLCLSLVVILFVIPTSQLGGLQFEEFFEEDTFWYGVSYAAGDKHPNYIGGIRRDISVFMVDFLPGGPITQFNSFGDCWYFDNIYLNPVVMFAGAVFFAAVPTMIGALLFRKKELN